MELNKELLNKVAKIARLELTEEEKNEFLPQLKEILHDFSKIQEVDTENLTTSFHPIMIKNVMRNDIVKDNCLKQEDALKNTEHKKDGFFIGPKTI